MKDFVLENKGDLWYGVFPKLQELQIRHAISTKLRGKSQLFGENLNISFNVQDCATAVYKNRQKIAAAIGINPADIVATRQVHGTNICRVDERHLGRGSTDLASALANTDALITNKTNLPLLLFVADCVPLIIYDPVQKAIGVVHAGWRGTVQRIAAKTVVKMQKEFGTSPQSCLAFIGPSIGPCCYEVDKVVAEAVRKQFVFAEQVLQSTSQDHWLFDLWQANKLQLQEIGLLSENIIVSAVCTVENKDLFFSHRAEKGMTGRMGVFVSL